MAGINPYVKPQKKTNAGLGTLLQAVGTIGGNLAGGVAGPAVGAALGSLAGEAVTPQQKAPEVSPTIGGQPGGGAMERRMAAIQEDPYQVMRSAAMSLGNLPADQRAAAGEPILKALAIGSGRTMRG